MIGAAIRWALDRPLVFDAYQRLIGAPACHARFLAEFVRPQAGERVLDVGCGVGASRPHLPDGIDYVGVDINAAYIERAKARYGRHGRFEIADLTRESGQVGGPFDKAFAFGVLHHLDDAAAARLIDAAMRRLRPGGTFATIDPCFVDGQPPIARWLARRDRGRHVRQAVEYPPLFAPWPVVAFAVYGDLLRVPYTQCVVAATVECWDDRC